MIRRSPGEQVLRNTPAPQFRHLVGAGLRAVPGWQAGALGRYAVQERPQATNERGHIERAAVLTPQVSAGTGPGEAQLRAVRVHLLEDDERDDVVIEAVEQGEADWWEGTRWGKYAPGLLLSNFYRTVYSTYIAVMIGVGTLLLKLADTNMTLAQALFLSASSISMTGLSTVDFPGLKVGAHVVVYLLIIVCSPMLLTLVPVLLRRASMRHQDRLNLAEKMQQYDEYRALGIIACLVLAYWVCHQLLGWWLLWWFMGGSWEQCWPALFLSISAFHNAGLNVLPSFPLDWSSDRGPAVLVVVMWLILSGNTWFPMGLRFLVWVLHHCVLDRLEGPSTGGALSLLVVNPRRCYERLFPGYITHWLMLASISLIALQAVVLWWADFHHHESDVPDIFKGYTFASGLWAIVFHAVSTRTAGFAFLDLSKLSAPTAFLFSVCMWISTCPAVVAMRYTRDLSMMERLEPDFDISGVHKEALQIEAKRRVRDIRAQAATFLGQHALGLVLMFWVILGAQQVALGSAAARSGLTATIFEFASAYGTVGLSMSNRAWSRSGDWPFAAQLMMIITMYMGRLRGLPESIDPSVRVTVRTYTKTDAVRATEEEYEDEEDDDSEEVE